VLRDISTSPKAPRSFGPLVRHRNTTLRSEQPECGCRFNRLRCVDAGRKTQQNKLSVAAQPPYDNRSRNQSMCFACSTGPSNHSIASVKFSVFSTITGNLLLTRSNPRGHKNMGFWNSFGTAGLTNASGEPLSETENLRHCLNDLLGEFRARWSPTAIAPISSLNRMIEQGHFRGFQLYRSVLLP